MSDNKMFMLMRFQIMSFGLTDVGRRKISDAYLYAWESGVFPQDHSSAHWHDDYKNDFDVPAERVAELSKMLDEKWTNKEKIPSVYDLEDLYDIRGGAEFWDRYKIISALRYFYLCGWFDKPFWDAIMVWTPSEAHGITRSFDRDEDIYFN